MSPGMLRRDISRRFIIIIIIITNDLVTSRRGEGQKVEGEQSGQDLYADDSRAGHGWFSTVERYYTELM